MSEAIGQTQRRVRLDAPAPYGGTYVEFEPGEWRHVESKAGYSETWINAVCTALADAAARVAALEADMRVIARAYDDCQSTGELATRLYDMSCIARTALLGAEARPGGD